MKTQASIALITLMTFLSFKSFAQTEKNLKNSIKNHTREIVFAGGPIEPGNETNLLTEYEIGSPLYIRFYMDSTIKQFIDKWKYSSVPVTKFKYFMIIFYIDDVYKAYKTKSSPQLIEDNIKTLNTYGVELANKTEGSNIESANFTKEYTEFIQKNSTQLLGAHKIKLEVYMSDGTAKYEKYATGVIKTKMDKMATTHPAEPVKAKAVEVAKPYYEEKAVVKDAALEAEFIKLYNEKFEGQAIAKKVYLKFAEWDVMQNENTGNPTKKIRVAAMYITNKDGCAYVTAGFAKDYEGGGKYGPIYFAGLTAGTYVKVECK
jgi:hypothetical protein